MKNMLLSVAIISVLAVTGGTAASAQVTDTIVADIPFGFMVRDTTLPAGEYTIKRIDSTSPGVMEMRSADGHEALVFLAGTALANKTPDQTELVFDRIGDQYFLTEIFEIGNSVGVELQKSRTERRLKKGGAVAEIPSVVVPVKTGINAKR